MSKRILVLALFNSLRTLVTKCLAIVLAVLLLIPLTACNPSTLLANPDQPPQLVDVILSDPKTFNFVIASDETSSLVGSMMLEGLTRQHPITGDIEPALAESWDISDDNLEIVYTLRPNLKWSDGQPLTPEDVVFTYNQLYLNPDIPTGMQDVLKIGETGAFPQVTKINQRQVKFTVPEPFAPFLGVTGASIFPAHILKETVEQKDESGNLKFLSTWSVDTPPEKLVASGAYKLKSYATAQRLVFEENPYYWKKDAVNKDIPYIKRVVWEIVESTDTFLTQFRSGSLNSVEVKPEYFSLLKKEEEKGNFKIYNGGPDYTTSYLAFNLNTGKQNGKPVVNPIKSRWFNNLKFRQAVAYALNRQRMVKNIYRGLGQPQQSFISVQSPFYNPNLKGYDYNPEKAKQLLKEAGFKYNPQGQLFDDQGNRVKFTLNTNTGNQIREEIGNQVEEDLEAIGIDINFKTINFNVLVGRMSGSLAWDAIILGFTGGNEPNSGANVWLPDGNSHVFNIATPAEGKPLEGRTVADWETEIGRLFIEAAKELDQEKRKVIYGEIQELVSEKVPFIYLVNPYSMAAVRNNIEGVEYSALGGAFWNLDQLKITE
ncbi:MAG: ABC transporter substrate-binding protein [Pleurocapsa sp. SU_5_0]|nr:ABC transporter substrate-binding protein [Pleurocapsa sp. SU_5_0]NJO95957.1 ABC transporter substrate-binding protein [Pleurocapsa sp. CRU_1_2]